MIFCIFAVVSTMPTRAKAQLCRDPDVVGLWHMNENAGDVIKDETENHNDGVIYGAHWVQGKFGSALYFDGSAYVDLGNGPSLNYLKDFTIEAWFKPSPESLGGRADPWAGFAIVITKYGLYQFDLQIHYGHLFGAFGLGYWYCAESVSLLEPDVWTYVAFTHQYDGHIRKLYINGIEVPTVQGTGLTGTTCGHLHFGTGSWATPPTSFSQAYFGVLEEVQITKRVLSGEEILDYYNSNSEHSAVKILVDIDIKPGSYPNAVNLGSHGLIPVAILSSAEFDATTADPDTIELAGSGVAVRGKGSKLMAHEEDVNGDGLVDLVVQVATANLDPESFQDGYAVLTGKTYDGVAIEGADEITIVPPEQ